MNQSQPEASYGELGSDACGSGDAVGERRRTIGGLLAGLGIDASTNAGDWLEPADPAVLARSLSVY